MMENRPTVTRFRSGIIGEDQPFLQTTRSRVYLAAPSIEQQEQLPLRVQSRWVAKSARWEGLTFDTKGENIIWSSGLPLLARRLDVVFPSCEFIHLKS
jgi:hypothetical protein